MSVFYCSTGPFSFSKNNNQYWKKKGFFKKAVLVSHHRTTHCAVSSSSEINNIDGPSEPVSRKSPFVLQNFKCSVCFESFSIDENFVTCSMDSVSEAAPGNVETHSMCLTCIKSYAHSSITGSSIAFGGIGLKCVEPECKNAFLLSTFEYYIDNTDYSPLQERLQQQCIADANLEDLVTCSGCGLRMCVPTTVKHYSCNCGRNNCRSCPRPFDAKHAGKTCKELEPEEANDVSLRNLETKMSEVVIRNCHKCGINFVKAEGCNKMECTCGGTQCYICSKQGIKYDHFCRCGNVNQQHGPCSTCRKSCRIWENFEDLDNKKINEILSSADPLLEKNKQPQFNKIVTPPENSTQLPAMPEPAGLIQPLCQFFPLPYLFPAPLQPIVPRAEQIVQRRNNFVPIQQSEALAHPHQPQVARNENPQQTDDYRHQQWYPTLSGQATRLILPPQLIPVPSRPVAQRADLDVETNLMIEALTHPPPGFTLPQGNHHQQYPRFPFLPPFGQIWQRNRVNPPPEELPIPPRPPGEQTVNPPQPNSQRKKKQENMGK